MNESAWNDVLSNHKIDKVTFYRFRARYPRLHGKNARLSYHGFGGEVLAARIYTNQGASGWGSVSTNLPEAREAAERIVGKKLTEFSLLRKVSSIPLCMHWTSLFTISPALFWISPLRR